MAFAIITLEVSQPRKCTCVRSGMRSIISDNFTRDNATKVTAGRGPRAAETHAPSIGSLLDASVPRANAQIDRFDSDPYTREKSTEGCEFDRFDQSRGIRRPTD